MKSEAPLTFGKLRTACVTIVLAMAVVFIGARRQISEQRLELVVETNFPVAAVNFINRQNYPGLDVPLTNLLRTNTRFKLVYEYAVAAVSLPQADFRAINNGLHDCLGAR